MVVREGDVAGQAVITPTFQRLLCQEPRICSEGREMTLPSARRAFPYLALSPLMLPTISAKIQLSPSACASSTWPLLPFSFSAPEFLLGMRKTTLRPTERGS